MKTIKDLNGKWWYRLVKVAYITSFFIILVASIGLIYDENNTSLVKDYLIQCKGGYANENSFYAYRDAGISIDPYGGETFYSTLSELERVIIRDRCDITQEEVALLYEKVESYVKERENLGDTKLQIQIDVQNHIDQNLRPYTITSQYITVGGWVYVIAYSMLAIFAILLVAEILKRIFYYVILGTINPQKN